MPAVGTEGEGEGEGYGEGGSEQEREREGGRTTPPFTTAETEDPLHEKLQRERGGRGGAETEDPMHEKQEIEGGERGRVGGAETEDPMHEHFKTVVAGAVKTEEQVRVIEGEPAPGDSENGAPSRRRNRCVRALSPSLPPCLPPPPLLSFSRGTCVAAAVLPVHRDALPRCRNRCRK